MKKIIAIFSVVCIVAAVRIVIAAGEWDSSISSFTVTQDFPLNGYNMDNVGVVSRIDPTSLGSVGTDGESSGTVAVDFSANSYYTINLVGTSTATISNLDDASGGVIEITQADANHAQLILSIADGGTFTASSSLGLTDGAGAVDILVFLWNPTAGKYRVSIENSHQAIDQ